MSKKSGIEKHPLYNVYYHYRRQNELCQEWKEDFWLFVTEVGDKVENCSFRKIDTTKPLSRLNFFWKEKILVNGEDHKSKAAAYAREWRKKNPDLAKSSDLKKSFGITIKDYVAMSHKQGGKCAICNSEETNLHITGGTTRKLAVDHNHTTGQVRGLLCGACNKAIGYFQEDVQRLKSAVTYLESFIPKDVPSNT
jgi:hypothetical protein